MSRLNMSRTVTKLERLKAEMDDARCHVILLEDDHQRAARYVATFAGTSAKCWLFEVTRKLDKAKAVYSAAEAAYRKAEQAHNSWVEEMAYAATEVDDGELQ